MFSNFIFTGLFQGIKDRQAQKQGARLDGQLDATRDSIDSSVQKQAEINMQEAAVQAARSDIYLDQWQTLMGSGTSKDDYIQKYMQGQANRDFQNPNALSPNQIMIGVGLMVVFFAVILIVLMNKKSKNEKEA